jgi:hypothetical protein
MCKWIAFFILLIPILAFAQTTSTDKSQTDVAGRIAALEARIAALENNTKMLQQDKIVIVGSKSKSRIELRIDQERPIIQLYDKDDKLILELGLSEWFGQPLVTIQNGDVVSYFWPGAEMISENQWKDIKTTAEQNCQGYLSDKLLKGSLVVNSNYDFSIKKWLVEIVVDSLTQPAWNYYTGTGKFSVTDREVRAAYLEAGKYIYEKIVLKEYTQEYMKDCSVKIYFAIKGYDVGIWEDGNMKLTGE